VARKKPGPDVSDGNAGEGSTDPAREKVPAPSGSGPNPLTNLVMADIALRGGGRLLRHAVERGLLQTKYSAGKARKIIRRRSMAQTLISTALARVATRSVPGAIIVGGGMLAKTLYDRRKGAGRARTKDDAAAETDAAKDAGD